MALIESLGFVSFEGFHTLPPEASVAPLQAAKAWLEKKRDELAAVRLPAAILRSTFQRLIAADRRSGRGARQRRWQSRRREN